MKRKSSSNIRIFPIFLALVVIIVGLSYIASGFATDAINHAIDAKTAVQMAPKTAVDIVQQHEIALIEARNGGIKPLFWFLLFVGISITLMGIFHFGAPFMKNGTSFIKSLKGKASKMPNRPRYIDYAPTIDDGGSDEETLALPAQAATEWLE